MINSKSAAAAVILCLAPAAACAQADPAPAETPRMITVSGRGEAAAAPDIARVAAAVVTQGRTAQDAMAANAAAMNRVFAAIREAGVEDRDMQTSAINLSPQYRRFGPGESGPPEISGYEAQNQVALRIRDIDGLGEVLDRLVASGANQFYGVSFDISDRTALLAEARRAAVADARAKAELYAEAAGVRLGQVLEISESGSYIRVSGARASSLAEFESTPVAGGESALSANVTIVYAID